MGRVGTSRTMPRKTDAPCGEHCCRRYEMTVSEFARLGRTAWSHGFSVRVGLRAERLYRGLYNKPPKKKRLHAAYRNPVNVYPCGILEQAYREEREASGIRSEDAR